MAPSELKWLYEMNNPEGFFFCRKTMGCFGDRMDNFGVRDAGKIKTGYPREEVDAWELYRKNPVEGGLYGTVAYFRKDNGQILCGVKR